MPSHAFQDADTTYSDGEYRPDHIMLLGATLVVVLVAYVLCQLPWPWLQRTAANQQRQKHLREEAAQDATLRRPHSPECSQMSPCRASAPVDPALHEPAATTFQSIDLLSMSSQQPKRPFRFRAADADEPDGTVWASHELQQHLDEESEQEDELEQAKQHVQHQLFSTPPLAQAPRQQLQQQQQQQEHQQQQPASGWDPELLAKYAADSPYISSVEALQRSPAFRSHISSIRGRRLNYETAESHKLRVYRALREVDPPGFQQLLNRKDVQEFEEEPPSRLLSAFECIASSLVTLSLLSAPWLVPILMPYKAHAAAAWAAMTALAATKGYASPIAGLMGMHVTEGPYNMLPSFRRVLVAALLEAALVVLTSGLGVLVSLGHRLLTQQRQSFSDRLMKFTPLREVVRPMSLSKLPAPATASFGCVADR